MAMNGVGRVQLVDPNKSIAVDPATPNGTPPVEIMRPYVELTAIRRRQGLIRVDERGRFSLGGNEEVLRVNLMNFDPEKKAYTEAYLDDVTGSDTPPRSIEGFGIRSISVMLNQNMMPLVDIVFVDLNGWAVARSVGRSPLSVLFDMPPPLFKLRLKGAFGKFVEYDLHIVRQGVSNGTGPINAYEYKVSFIGQFYGPITDIKLGFLKAVPYLRGEGIVGASALGNNGGAQIRSFYDLIMRGMLLYTAVDNYATQSGMVEETRALTGVAGEVVELETSLRGALTQNSVEGSVRDYMREHGQVELTESLRVNPEGARTPADILVLRIPHPVLEAYNQAKKNRLATVSAVTKAVVESVIKPLEAQYGTLGAGTSQAIKIDWTPSRGGLIKATYTQPEDYLEVVYDFQGLRKRLNEIKGQVGQQEAASLGLVQGQLQAISNTVLDSEGATVGHVVGLMLDDADYLLDRIRLAGQAPKTDPTRESGGATVFGGMSWPTVIREEVLRGGGKQPAKQWPGLYPAFQQWPEVQLVEEYCRALTKAEKDLVSTENVQMIISSDTFVATTPWENLAFSPVEVKNPYVRTASLPEVLQLMAQRYLVLQEYGYALLFHTSEYVSSGVSTAINGSSVDPVDGETYATIRAGILGDSKLLSQSQRRELIESLAKVEARNAAQAIQSNTTLLNTLKSAPLTSIDAIYQSLTSTPSPSTVYQPLFTLAGSQALTLTLDNGVTVSHRAPGSTSFRGIVALYDGESPKGKALRTVRGTGGGALPSGQALPNPIDEATTEFLQGLGQTLTRSGTAAQVNEAGLLLFPDGAAAEAGKSDFFTELNDRDIIGQFVELVLLDGDGNARSFAGVASANLLDVWMHYFSTQGNIEYLYAKGDRFNGDVIRRFMLPGTIEMPRWYACWLAYRSLGETYNPQTQTATPWSAGEEFVSGLDRTTLRAQLEEVEVAALLAAFNSAWTRTGRSATQTAERLRDEPAWQRFLAPVYLVNASSLTFLQPEDDLQQPRAIRGLLSKTGKVRSPFTLYARTFARELKQAATEGAKETQQQLSKALDQLRDPDYKAAVYYSFQELYTRWLAGVDQRAPLRDSFRYITRSYQDIGKECIVDFKGLIDAARTTDTALFTALGDLFQSNNFLFFPLHSHLDMGAEIGTGGNNFTIHENLTADSLSKPAFICMYVGGYSSQVADPSNQDYPDDGFSFGADQPIDFNEEGTPLVAYRVREGQQNQSVFGKVSLSSEEFKATEESLRLEDSITRQQADSFKIHKAQNLLNVYRQRSFVCTVPVPGGNMTLQPTQYFNLEGTPVFDGAYLVFSVTHEITAESQRLHTEIKGNRLGRHVFRVVNSPLMDYVGLGDTANRVASGAQITNIDGSLNLGGPVNPRAITEPALRALVKPYGYDLNMIKAFIKVESGRAGFDSKTGKVTIRFEPKQFLKRKFGGQLVGAEYAVNAKGERYIRETGHKDQATEWATFEQARQINEEAAYQCTSWGAMQVMGFNHASGGYRSAKEMAQSYGQSEENQIRGALNFIRSNKPLERAIRGLNFRNTAYYYNGPDYEKGNYHVKIEKAYRMYAAQVQLPETQTLQLRREQQLPDRVLGTLQHQGQLVAHTLEDSVRPKGVFQQGITAIEPGIYEVMITKSPSLGRETPVLLGVPHHEDGMIRLHRGAGPDDSRGCVLVGSSRNGDRINTSAEAEEKVTAYIRSMLRQGKVYLQIT
jgi:N-acetylmuramidase/Family of unknown function (DUF5675)